MITREQFMAYYHVQQLGYYNMFDKRAMDMTGLSIKTYFDIIKNYNTYYDKYIKED